MDSTIGAMETDIETKTQTQTQAGQGVGRVVIVTGASSGIGQAIAERFVNDGDLIVALSRSECSVDGAEWRQCDVSSSAEVDSVVADVIERYGQLDVLINNAGVQVEKSIADTTDADYDLVMNVNVRGVFNGTRAAVRAMRDGDGGVIINIGSTAATHADHGMAVYNASKGAVQALTRAVAIDHGRDGIRCVTVAPGWVSTALADAAFDLADNPDEARATAVAGHPVGRLGRPEDVAGLVAWLASTEAGYASGSVFTLDGGAMAASPIGG